VTPNEPERPTIDQRLEGLARTVEILAAMQRDNEIRFAQVTRNFEIVLDSIKRLENIATAHERRLGRLEG
jgi:hypothetical protein